MKSVIVPKQDMEKVEKARLEMYEFLQNKLSLSEMFHFVDIEGNIA